MRNIEARRRAGRRASGGTPVTIRNDEQHRLERNNGPQPRSAMVCSIDRNNLVIASTTGTSAHALRLQKTSRIFQANPDRDSATACRQRRHNIVGMNRRGRIDQVDDRLHPNGGRHRFAIFHPGRSFQGSENARLANTPFWACGK